jgi:hypothetical protein
MSQTCQQRKSAPKEKAARRRLSNSNQCRALGAPSPYSRLSRQPRPTSPVYIARGIGVRLQSKCPYRPRFELRRILSLHTFSYIV